jgi:KaiC/GvpD/RAD55 family RecA-like ATPase
LANGIGTGETLNVVAPPGTGKTTTLVQLAETLVFTPCRADHA